MNLNKLVNIVRGYFKKEHLEESQEKKVLNIIKDLKEKKAQIKSQLTLLDKEDRAKKEELEKQLMSISMLIRKSNNIIKKG
ncbi:MAG: hypothetical protein GX118_04600 [Arcobacter butzleri]|jgi:hypothetical protein|nr:hypothetical protein [Arcobacteraceae bacterium]MDY0364734.1 hypothetical protein [Arcobacteraceae bacterium]NLO17450.1 hypothetical protein [Aliarcobacter butzleri]